MVESLLHTALQHHSDITVCSIVMNDAFIVKSELETLVINKEGNQYEI